MSSAKDFQLALAPLFIYDAAWVTDLDLGGFGNALLIAAVVFGILALTKADEKDTDNDLFLPAADLPKLRRSNS